MNDKAQSLQAKPATDAKPKPKPVNAMSRIRLALLDQYSLEEAGSDPYNTTKSTAKPDQWRGNARRI